jgi:hypothetical protein
MFKRSPQASHLHTQLRQPEPNHTTPPYTPKHHTTHTQPYPINPTPPKQSHTTTPNARPTNKHPKDNNPNKQKETIKTIKTNKTLYLCVLLYWGSYFVWRYCFVNITSMITQGRSYCNPLQKQTKVSPYEILKENWVKVLSIFKCVFPNKTTIWQYKAISIKCLF